MLFQLRSPQQAAVTAIYLATCPPDEAAAANGEYFEDAAVAETLGCCADEAVQEHLWAHSQRFCDTAKK
jgi:hypothetical protein